MKNKKILVLLSSLALLLGACNGQNNSSKGDNSSSAPASSQSQSDGSQGGDSGGQTDVAVTGITLNKTTLSLEEKASETLTVTVAPSNASNTKVTWESSNAAIATVSSLGKVTAVAVGTATITVKSQSNPDVKAECVVTVTEEGGKYGSLNKPKTVAKALEIVAEECKESGNNSKEQLYVQGYVSRAVTVKDGYVLGVYLKDSLTDANAKEFYVYSADTTATTIPYQNDLIVAHGYVTNYSGTIEMASVTPTGGTKTNAEIAKVVERGTSTIKYVVDDGTVNADAPKSAKNLAEVSFTVTPASGKSVNSIYANGTKLDAQTDGSYKMRVTGNMTVNINIFETGVEIKNATMKYTGKDTGNMAEGNNADKVNLDPSLFTVTSTNTTGPYAGLNKNGDFRLYNNRNKTTEEERKDGTTVTVSSKRADIKKIVVTLAGTTSSRGFADLEVKADGAVVAPGQNEGIYLFNASSFSLQNVSKDTASQQIHISSIEIFYAMKEVVKATAIQLDKATAEIEVDKTVQLTATLTPSNANEPVVWMSSDATKATVSQSGLVTGVAEGSAKITAFVDANGDAKLDESELKAECNVTVTKAEVLNYGTAEAPLTLTEAKALLDKVGNMKYTKEPMYVKGIISTNKAFSADYHNGEVWLQSDDGTVAKDFELWSCEIDASLNFEGDPKADELVAYEVVATGYGEKYNSTYELTNFTPEGGSRINPKIVSMEKKTLTVTGITLDKQTLELEVGAQAELKAGFVPGAARADVTWKSSDEAKATVAAGKVTGVAAGSATITAFIDANSNGAVDEGEIKAECAVTVKEAAPVVGVQYTLDVSDANWPTSAETEATAHTIGNVAVKTCGLNKDTSDNAQSGGDIFMKKNAGYLYNTASLGKILSIKVTFSANTSAGKYVNIVLGSSALDARNTDSANAITFAKSETVEVKNTADNIGYFNISNNQGSGGKNIRIVKIVITCAE